MKCHRYPETDTVYIEFSDKKSVECLEIADGVVVDFDDEGNLLGIDIDNASRKLGLFESIIEDIPDPDDNMG